MNFINNVYKQDENEVRKHLAKDIKKSKYLFYVSSICIILSLVIMSSIDTYVGIGSTMYFLAMILMLLPKINKFNNDSLSILNNEVEVIENKLLAVFPIEVDEPNKDWMIFVQTSENEYIEFEIPSEVGLSLKEEDIVFIKYTKCNAIVLELFKK